MPWRMPWRKPLLATQNAIRRKMQEYRSDFEEMYHWAKKEKSLQLYTFSRIKVATRNFSERIGSGSSGSTYKGQLLDGLEIAVKRYKVSSRQPLTDVKYEIKVVTCLLHPNVLGPRGYCFRPKHLSCCIEGNKEEIILIYDYMPNKSLDYFIYRTNRGRLLDWPERRHIIYGIAQGLVYLHEFAVIHMDIKPSNILLDHDMNPKISFTLPSIILRSGEPVFAGTRTGAYIDPQFMPRGIRSVKSDVYSFGVTMLEIISGKRLSFISDQEEDLLSQACRLWMDGNWHKIIDPTIYHTYEDTEIRRFIHVALLCIRINAEDRPTMHDVTEMLRHESIFRPAPKPLQLQYEERRTGRSSVVITRAWSI